MRSVSDALCKLFLVSRLSPSLQLLHFYFCYILEVLERRTPNNPLLRNHSFQDLLLISEFPKDSLREDAIEHVRVKNVFAYLAVIFPPLLPQSQFHLKDLVV